MVVSYLDILQDKVDLPAVLSQTDYLRLESPGENFELLRQLLALGAEHPNLGAAEQISAQKSLTLPFEKGRIQYLRQAILALSFCGIKSNKPLTNILLSKFSTVQKAFY